jgi:metal transporter CNNM
VYIDVHKAIRRLQPAPTYRRGSKGYIAKDAVAADQKNIANEQNGSLIEIVDEEAPKSADAKKNGEGAANGSPAQQLEAQRATVMMRRGSSAQGERRGATPVTVRASDVREHLKHLGPSNLASRPKSTRYQSVKIKPGHVVLDNKVRVNSFSEPPYRDDPGESSQQPLISYIDGAESGAESDTLLANAGRMASDGVQAHLRSDYGSFAYAPAVHVSDTGSGDDTQSRPKSARKGGSDGDSSSQDGGKDRLGVPDGPRKKRGVARSGSITENIVDSHGVRKMILQTTSSSEGEGANDFNRPETIDESKEEGNGKDQADNDEDGSVGMKNGDKGEEVKKKKKRNRKRKGKSGGSEAGGSNN